MYWDRWDLCTKLEGAVVHWGPLRPSFAFRYHHGGEFPHLPTSSHSCMRHNAARFCGNAASKGDIVTSFPWSGVVRVGLLGSPYSLVSVLLRFDVGRGRTIGRYRSVALSRPASEATGYWALPPAADGVEPSKSQPASVSNLSLTVRAGGFATSLPVHS